MDLAANIAAYLTSDDNQQAIAANLAAYYQEGSSVGNGRVFDELCRKALPNRFDEIDFDAVSALGTRLSDEVRAAIRERNDELESPLLELDLQVRFMPIWDAPDSVWAYPDSLLARLFLLLRDDIPGVGAITASRLLACKYPELVPVRDIVTERIIGTDHTGPWGRMWRAALTPEVRTRLVAVSTDVVPKHVSLLRRAGVALWMAGTRHPTVEIRADGTLSA